MGKQEILDLLTTNHPHRLNRQEIAKSLDTTPVHISKLLTRLQMDRAIAATTNTHGIKFWGLRPKT
jgi:CRP-like cAMP-binding protein